ncbi:NUDIX hydrolase [Bacillus sp. SA1-12]|uniref:NUDIX domain-containing protein n=1 Tax=Bacillus sp. SA1-12 TaxID=1455638 RepID=UPI00062705BC|nr:NUDIX domain-containing protein [Bacillus sp. SA1-12]KKI90401.1 NUDIX hydrolase [Bacillus sp. SA1-12]
MDIRNSVKAIIISEDKVLLTKNQDNEGFFYLYPGGGQEHGETFHHALIRECLEEIGHSVEIGKLLHIREYIGKNHEYSAFDYHVHQVEYYFVCNLMNEINNHTKPTNPDAKQVGIEWIALNELHNYRVYPRGLSNYIKKYNDGKQTQVYLGDIN